MSEKEIDAIDDIVEMGRMMTSLGISSKGLRTLDEMKLRVKETLRLSKKKSSWTAKEAFSVLTDAKQEDERKRDILYKFYEDTEACLNRMDDTILRLLEQSITNCKDKIAWRKKNLQQKEYIVLVIGETRSGKSTLLNLILGEQLLPCPFLSTTSTICELKYGTTPKLVAHFKSKDPVTGQPTRTVQLRQFREASEQSNLEKISSFVHVKTDREEGSAFKKIELFWPHILLKQGIVIVDSPGVGESGIVDDIVKEYLPDAFAFIYVINSVNAGEIQRDRLEELLKHTNKASLHELRVTSSPLALFVCNKWDQVPPGDANELKDYIVKKLTCCWPNLDRHSQIIYMSSTNASEAQALGIITEEFEGLMNGIKSMVLKSIEARLQTNWSWLDYLLFRMAYHTKAFLQNSIKDRQKVIERMMLRQVVARIPELIGAEKMLCQQLRDENRSQKEIEEFYKPLCQRSLQLRGSMAMFGIKEVRTVEFCSNDLEWQDDRSSLLGTGAFASVYRGKLKLAEKEQPVAIKVWKDQLNDSNAGAFLAEAMTLRKLDHPCIVKSYGSSLLKEGDQVRAVLVMELCKDNLMRHIFQNPKNIPARMQSSTPPTDRTTIRWAKDIAIGLEYIHKQGYVHRDLKLENILISLDDVVKIADFGVSKEDKMMTGTITGTPTYMPPEVIRSRVYDSKVNMYSFAIMMWEMWYGRRAYLEVGGDQYTFWDRVAEGTRPSHIEGTRMPPDLWQNLMQNCWDGEAEKRPNAATCHNELTKLYSTV